MERPWWLLHEVGQNQVNEEKCTVFFQMVPQVVSNPRNSNLGSNKAHEPWLLSQPKNTQIINLLSEPEPGLWQGDHGSKYCLIE